MMSLMERRWDNRPATARPAMDRVLGCPFHVRRQCIRAWILASIFWLVILGGLAAFLIGDHVAASREVALDIAQLDCTTVKPCAAAAGGEQWTDVADLVWTFGARYVLAAILIPPAALLLLGGTAIRLRHARPRLARLRLR